jgi:DHA3 family macrolide efflux protein-like MFS transporter
MSKEHLPMNSKKNVWLLLVGRCVSKFGSAFYLIVFPLYILETTGSLVKSGFFFSVSSLPVLLITPLIGLAVEKNNRKWVLVFCDFATAMIYSFLLVIPEKFNGYMFCLLLGTMLIHGMDNAFEISSKMIFSELVPAELIEKYNGIKSILDNGTAVIAPALGTALFGIWGFKIVLLIVAAAYFLSALQECFIIYQKPDKRVGLKSGNWRRDLADGISYVKNSPMVLRLFMLVMALNFFVANADEIINPGIIIQIHHIPQHLFGMISTAAVFGTIVAGFFIYKNTKIDMKSALKKNMIFNSVLMLGLGVLSLLFMKYPMIYFLIYVVLNFMIGIITTCVNVPLSSYFQVQVPIEYQGRFFALLTVASGLLIPLGISYTGLLAEMVGADVAYIINNICVIVIVCLCV